MTGQGIVSLLARASMGTDKLLEKPGTYPWGGGPAEDYHPPGKSSNVPSGFSLKKLELN